MTIKPMRGYPRELNKAKAEKQVLKLCENCGAKLDSAKNKKYCDKTCYHEHLRKQALARRPEQVLCKYCSKEIDVMRASAHLWNDERAEHFCDSICCDAYRRQVGHYAEMSKVGNAKMREYKEKHGKVYQYEKRAQAVSQNNKKAPPRAKYFVRSGKAWGYDVTFYPDENGYRVSVPEIDELGIMHAKTQKDGLRLVRVKILELRAKSERLKPEDGKS